MSTTVQCIWGRTFLDTWRQRKKGRPRDSGRHEAKRDVTLP